MDTKYHMAANVASGCKANPNVDVSLMKYKNDWGNQQHPWSHSRVPSGTPDSYSGPQSKSNDYMP